MSVDRRIGFRLSGELHAAIAALGEPSAVSRTLLLLGLHSAGQDVRSFCGDAWADVPALHHPALQQALLNVLNSGSTVVQHDVAPVLVTRSAAAEPAPADLWTVGIEV